MVVPPSRPPFNNTLQLILTLYYDGVAEQVPTACIFLPRLWATHLQNMPCYRWYIGLILMNGWLLRKAYKGHGRSQKGTQPSLFVLPSRWCTANTWGVSDKCKRRSWTNTKRLLKSLLQGSWTVNFGDALLFWKPDPPLSVDLIGNSKVVTSLYDRNHSKKSVTMFSCAWYNVWLSEDGCVLCLEYFHTFPSEDQIMGSGWTLKTWNPTVFHHWLVLFQWREIPPHTTTGQYWKRKGRT